MIYVISEGGEDTALVDAANRAQAFRHAALTKFKIRKASQQDLVKLVQNGVDVEPAKTEEPAETPRA